MNKTRFSKRAVTEYCDRRIGSIQAAHKYQLSNGTAQLRLRHGPPTAVELDRMIDRAVEYGRLRAFEDVANAVEEGIG